MTDNNYGIRDIKNQHLRSIYKKYTDYIINFEKHIERLFDDWVIDINHRNYLLQQLDNMIKSMMRIYNTNLMKIYKESDQLTSEVYSDGDKTNENLATFGKMNLVNYDSIYKNIYDGIHMIEQLENVKNETINPFHEIRTEILALSRSNGLYSLDDFFKIYISDQYTYLFDKTDFELFELYNKVFVPTNISIDTSQQKKNITNKFKITKSEIKCDSLINNTCCITIMLDSLPAKITFEGYIQSDVLNTYVRTSQIYSKYIFKIKSESKSIIKKSYSYISDQFMTRYTKLVNSSIYFINNSEELVGQIISDYDLFIDLTTKNFNLIMKEFVHGDVQQMYNIINLLLMGNEQNICTAGLLFNLLKDKKISGETLIDIIYHNLSYYAQIKLKKITNSMKSELARIKSLTPENISIEKRLASLINMPDNVKAYILEKINEIKSGENNYKIQMAINGLMQFPWKPKDYANDFSTIRNSMIKSRDYLHNVALKLDKTVYGHENSKKRLLELVGKWIQRPDSDGKAIGLVGPPGVGKTLFAKSVSAALGIPLTIVGLGGMSDAADLIGHSFTYAGAQYGMIVRQMIKAGNWRCVMLFDELDKVSKKNETNEIYNTLIHITDQNMNQHFQDRFYSSSIEFDLSGVLIIFSYNNSDKVDPILLDRMDEIKVAAYSTQEKITIAEKFMIKELCENIGFDQTKIQLSDEILRYIIEKYTMEAGVRELKRKLEQILLKLNIDRYYMRGPFRELMHRKYLETFPDVSQTNSLNRLAESEIYSDEKKEGLTAYIDYKKSRIEDLLDDDIVNKIFNLEFDDKIVITQKLVYRYLDKPLTVIEEIHKTNLVGVINGLYATSMGIGGIVPIQIYKNYIGAANNGSNLKLKLTGNQKQVMRESVSCALTTAISILNKNIKDKVLANFPYGFHIHAPDGGTPKDGPSAGCAFTTAFVSALLGKKINRTVAMTGEIELTGKISKIGGLDAKLHGAKKAGITRVYICEENKEDYELIKKKSPELFKENFEIVIINHIIDIVSDPYVMIGITEDDFDLDVLNEHKQKIKFSDNEI
jgi:endopeptidase La